MLSAYYNNPFLADFCLGRLPLRLASRQSPLAVLQAHECLRKLQAFFPRLWGRVITTATQGDLDQHTPLHAVENTGFFTDDVDLLVQSGECDLGIHSAKDLPENPQTSVVAITASIDPRDVLIFHEKYLSIPLPLQLRIGSSSARRKELLSSLYPSATIMDLRGTIQTRLKLLKQQKFDAIVMANAAVSRLGLRLPCTKILPPPYHPLQGRLAITACQHIASWKNLFLLCKITEDIEMLCMFNKNSFAHKNC